MDGFWFRGVRTLGHRGLKDERVAKKGDYRLRHFAPVFRKMQIWLLWPQDPGHGIEGKVVRNRGGEWVFSEM
jgi:hypothetical protein